MDDKNIYIKIYKMLTYICYITNKQLVKVGAYETEQKHCF